MSVFVDFESSFWYNTYIIKKGDYIMGRKALSGVSHYDVEIYNDYNQLAKTLSVKGYYSALEAVVEYLNDKVLAGEITIKFKPVYIQPPACMRDYTPNIPMEGRQAEISEAIKLMRWDVKSGWFRRR